MEEPFGDRLEARTEPQVEMYPAHEKTAREPAGRPRAETSLETGDGLSQLSSVLLEPQDFLRKEIEKSKNLHVIVVGRPGTFGFGDDRRGGLTQPATLLILLPTAAGAGIVPAGLLGHAG